MKTFDLPEDWALTRDGQGWRVIELDEGSCYDCRQSYHELSRGKTVVEAIRNARLAVKEQQENADARRADYEKRKAEGKLTELEKANERLSRFIEPLWREEVLKAINSPTVFQLIGKP